MGSVGEERERVRHYSHDNLEGHEPDNQQQRDRQIPTVRVRAHAVRVTAGSMVVISVIVTKLAHLSMPILIESSRVVHVTPRYSG
jgi:hypothetical protein